MNKNGLRCYFTAFEKKSTRNKSLEERSQINII